MNDDDEDDDNNLASDECNSVHDIAGGSHRSLQTFVCSLVAVETDSYHHTVTHAPQHQQHGWLRIAQR